MMGDMYKRNTCLDFPKGGNEALVGALVRGIEKHAGQDCLDTEPTSDVWCSGSFGCSGRGQVLLKAHVEEVLVEGGRAAGVRLKDGRVVRAHTVVSPVLACKTNYLTVPACAH